jgi:hypothetical protein
MFITHAHKVSLDRLRSITSLASRNTGFQSHESGPDDPLMPPDDLMERIDIDGRADVGSPTRVRTRTKSGL